MIVMKGGCRCGAIRYEATGDSATGIVCHCRDCQYVTGGGPSYDIGLPRQNVTITKGEPRVYWSTAASGKRTGRMFCGTCGTPLLIELESMPDVMAIAVGSLDDPSAFKPTVSIWTGSAQPWSHIDPALPQFEKQFR